MGKLAVMSRNALNHFWFPTPMLDQRGGKRHAFRGRRWDGVSVGIAICAEEVVMARPSEMDWIILPICPNCYAILRDES